MTPPLNAERVRALCKTLGYQATRPLNEKELNHITKSARKPVSKPQQNNDNTATQPN